MVPIALVVTTFDAFFAGALAVAAFGAVRTAAGAANRALAFGVTGAAPMPAIVFAAATFDVRFAATGVAAMGAFVVAAATVDDLFAVALAFAAVGATGVGADIANRGLAFAVTGAAAMGPFVLTGAAALASASVCTLAIGVTLLVCFLARPVVLTGDLAFA
jgi:hypothetical protein